MQKITENNQVNLIGKIASVPIFSHEVFGEKFYLVDLIVFRLSCAGDTIPLLLSERLITIESLFIGDTYSIIGDFRSYNKFSEDGRNHLELSAFVKSIEFIDETEHVNQISIRGFICKPPIYRKTPKGREITDMLVAVNGPYGRSDYIPCIAWSRNAIFMANAEVGTKVEITGRTQSREYSKKISDEDFIVKTAYEISISFIKVVEDEK